jgi:hypothetical protein
MIEMGNKPAESGLSNKPVTNVMLEITQVCYLIIVLE